MMNDPLAAQLRAHLLGSANERAPEGQVAAIVEHIGRTAQRRPIVVRLADPTHRAGGSRRRAVAYGLLAAALVGVMAAMAILGAGSAPSRRTSFEGTWHSTDPADGSVQTLVVGPGTHPPIRFEDAYASGAACENDEVKRFTAEGSGEIVGRLLVATFPHGGGCGLVSVEVAGLYDHIASTDTLRDQDGVEWVRQPDGDQTVVPPTISPVPSDAPEPPDQATSDPGCRGYHGGDTYRAPAGDLTLTVTLPGGSKVVWQGFQDSFSLLRAPCVLGSALQIQASRITRIHPDACRRPDLGSLIRTPEEAVAALSAQQGLDVAGQEEVTIAGYPAAWFELSGQVGLDEEVTCTGGVLQPMDGISSLDSGERHTVYVIDVDGTPLALVISGVGADVDSDVASIIDTLVIESTPPPSPSATESPAAESTEPTPPPSPSATESPAAESPEASAA